MIPVSPGVDCHEHSNPTQGDDACNAEYVKKQDGEKIVGNHVRIYRI